LKSIGDEIESHDVFEIDHNKPIKDKVFFMEDDFSYHDNFKDIPNENVEDTE